MGGHLFHCIRVMKPLRVERIDSSNVLSARLRKPQIPAKPSRGKGSGCCFDERKVLS
jgi:hypothetical protein